MISTEMRNFRTNFKYKIEGLDILFSDGTIEKINSGMVTHLYIEKDFDNLIFPIINLSVVIPDITYDRINRENETVKFRVKVNKMIYNTAGTFLKYECLFNDIFICFLDKTVVVKDKDSYTTKKNVELTETQNDRSNNRQFYLFKEDVVTCKKIHNLSVSSATLSDLVLYLYQATGINKLLMSKLDNQTSIKNLLLPTGNIVDCMRYLDELKGFYRKGLLMFFDIDTAYFIDNSSKCTAWRKNEVRVTHMHVSNQQDNDSELLGVYVDKDRKSSHIFTNTNRIQINNPNLINDQLNGNNITVVNNKHNKIDKINEKTTQVGKANKKILVAKEDNQYTIETMKYRMRENECVMNITFSGIDLDVLTPNKEFLITYEDTSLNVKYGGNYRLSKMAVTLRKDGEELVSAAECIFKKQE